MNAKEEHKPIHKFNNGRGATLCGKCHVIISQELGLSYKHLGSSCGMII